MKCSHCNTPMDLVREETTNRSVVRWHRCPACGSAHMLSEPSQREGMLPLWLGQRGEPEFRPVTQTYGSAYSGPERRGTRRSWLR